MNEEIKQSDLGEEEELTCPECGKGFQDMRGLTSHARHIHGMEKKELKKLYNLEVNNEINGWKIFGGISAFLVALLTLGKMR